MRRLLIAIVIALVPSFAYAQASFTFKDAGGTTRTATSFNCSSQICQLFVPADVNGNALSGTVAAGTAPTSGLAILGVYNSAAPGPSSGQSVALQLDSNANLKVSIAAQALSDLATNVAQIAGSSVSTAATGVQKVGTVGNAGAIFDQATGSSVPANVLMNGINVGGTSRGWTGVNPSGSIYAGQVDLASVGGTSVALGSTTASASVPVVLASNQTAGDPCMFQAKSFADFESGTSGGSIVTGVSGKKIYICSIRSHVSAATNFSLIEGTGSSVCTGGTTAGVYLNTGTTAANGAAYAANGGDAFSGSSTLAATANAANNLCVAFTTTNSPQVNVHIAYVQQ